MTATQSLGEAERRPATESEGREMTDRIRQPLRQTNCVTRVGAIWQVDRVTWTWSGRTIEHLASFQTEAEAETYAREEAARSAAAAMTLGKRPRQAV